MAKAGSLTPNVAQGTARGSVLNASPLTPSAVQGAAGFRDPLALSEPQGERSAAIAQDSLTTSESQGAQVATAAPPPPDIATHTDPPSAPQDDHLLKEQVRRGNRDEAPHRRKHGA